LRISVPCVVFKLDTYGINTIITCKHISSLYQTQTSGLHSVESMYHAELGNLS